MTEKEKEALALLSKLTGIDIALLVAVRGMSANDLQKKLER